MFALRRAANPLRSRLHCVLRSYHTKSKSKSDILHQISPAQSNNLHQIQPNHRNLFTFRGFNSQSEQQQQQLPIKKQQKEDGFSELDDPHTSEKTSTKKPARRSSNPKFIPQSNSVVLSFYVDSDDLEKAEQLFEEIQDSGSPISSSDCRTMIRLYKKFDKEKIKSVLSFMEENDVEPDLRTYGELLVSGDYAKLFFKQFRPWEKLFEAVEKPEFADTMESDGFVLIANYIRAEIARHYISRGNGKISWLNSKAEEVMKQMEGKQGWEENRVACKLLLPLYAHLRKADEIERIWKVCESFGRVDDYSAAISAFCKVRRVKKAEEIFEKGIKAGMSISYKAYADLMNVYVGRKLLAKAEDLVKRMATSSRPISNGRSDSMDNERSHYLRFVRDYCDALVKLCVNAGEVEKADSVLLLQKALKERGDLALQKEYSCSYYLDMDDSSIVKKRLTKKELKQRRTTVY
ncbi:hypothetical protein MKW92_005222 [Papaver armeniacum]|nr:hypothetical protein MKW92_005222 [Papaver armeniacum]